MATKSVNYGVLIPITLLNFDYLSVDKHILTFISRNWVGIYVEDINIKNSDDCVVINVVFEY